MKTIAMIALIVGLLIPSISLAGELSARKATVKQTSFCSTNREAVCVKTSIGELNLPDPLQMTGMDHASFVELFYDLHLVEGDTVTLLLDGQDIVGLDTGHFKTVAQAWTGKNFPVK